MPTPEPCKIDLWTWPLEVGPGELARLRALLSEDEVERADRLVMERDRIHFVAARGRLRGLLAEYCSTRPQDLTFAYSEHGKPSLRSAPKFNLSHSNALAALAVTKDHDVGLDVEAMRTIKENLARDNFSPNEQRELATLSAHDRMAGFFRCWTRKEAVIKATGEGFARDLMSFDVSLSREDPRLLRLDGDDPSAWRLVHLDLQAGYVGAIACRTGGAPIIVTRRG
jgi:4'-phosphopantetheinyl transferase